MKADKKVLECISKRTAFAYLEVVEETQGFRLNQEIEMSGNKIKNILNESSDYLEEFKQKLDPEYELIDLESDCTDINMILDDLAEDNEYLNYRLEIITKTFY